MERLHQPYDAVMSMPVARRRRFCLEIEQIDKMRAQNSKKR
jgi:hypothetical protein